MPFYSNSLAKIKVGSDLTEANVDKASVSYEPPVSCCGIGAKANSFFNCSREGLDFPKAYAKIWNKIKGNSTQKRIRALLLDYTHENFIMGSLIGRVLTGHWNRNHIIAVSKILTNMSVNNYYGSSEDIVADLKTIKLENKGSLYQRIKFIEMKLEEQLQCNFKT